MDSDRAFLRRDVDGLPAEARLGAWLDIYSEHFYALDAEALRAPFVNGRVAMFDIAGVRAAYAEASPVRWRRTRSHDARSPSGDYYLLPLPLDAAVRLEQCGREVTVTPEVLALFGAEPGYDHHQMSSRFWSLRIPGRALRARIPDMDDQIARARSTAEPTVRLAHDYLLGFVRDGRGMAPDEQEAARNILLDLLALAFAAPATAVEAGETAVRVAHRRRLMRFLDANFQDPELDLAATARGVGVSKRYLQRLLGERDATLTGLLRDRRILEAKRLLAEPGAVRPTIAQVAYAVGFADPAHFSRTFRAETGMSPRDYRIETTGR